MKDEITHCDHGSHHGDAAAQPPMIFEVFAERWRDLGQRIAEQMPTDSPVPLKEILRDVEELVTLAVYDTVGQTVTHTAVVLGVYRRRARAALKAARTPGQQVQKPGLGDPDPEGPHPTDDLAPPSGIPSQPASVQ